MSDISIAEFLVYGFLTYSSLGVLIFSVAKGLNPERSRVNVLAHVIFILPGLLCAPLLAMSGPNIQVNQTTETIKDLNSTQTWSDTTTQNIVLQNQTWLLVHMMIFFVLLIYVVREILLFLMAPG